ncbi:MAG: hypothetical protein ACM3XM_16815, partial [Mycobacterium leprae]
AAMFLGIYAFAAALTWVAAAKRPWLAQATDLIDSTAQPEGLRVAAEMTGCLLTAGAFMLLILLVDLAIALIGSVGKGGSLAALWLVGPLALPPLLTWLTLSRMAARYLSAPVSYLTMLLLWAAGIWQNGIWSLSYIPPTDTLSTLTLYGVSDYRTLLWHRAVIFGVGLAAGVGAVLPHGTVGRTAWRGLRVWLLVTLGAAAVSVPGLILLQNAARVPSNVSGWVELAASGRRWSTAKVGETTLYLSPIHRQWAEGVAGGLRQLRALDGGAAVPTIVVEAPVDQLLITGDAILVPEQLLTKLESTDMLRRRLITRWVEGSARNIPAAGLKRSMAKAEGISYRTAGRLLLEWRYVEALLGHSQATAEIGAWCRMIGTAPCSDLLPPTAGSPLPADLSALSMWRGGRPSLESTGVTTAIDLYRRLAGAEIPTVKSVLPQWEGNVGALGYTPEARKAELDRFVQAVHALEVQP